MYVPSLLCIDNALLIHTDLYDCVKMSVCSFICISSEKLFIFSVRIFPFIPILVKLLLLYNADTVYDTNIVSGFCF